MKTFSDFIRNATESEKRAVYLEVIDEACDAQRKVMGLPAEILVDISLPIDHSEEE